jgi:hypothetical protein
MDKSFFFFFKKERSSFLKKRSKRLLSLWVSPDHGIFAAGFAGSGGHSSAGGGDGDHAALPAVAGWWCS